MFLMILMTIGLPILVYFDDEGGRLPAGIMFGIIATMKFSLSSKGILIKYNKYDELYISPEDQDQFIKELQEKNTTIKVV